MGGVWGAAWSDDRVDMLKKMAGDGMSATQIARELGQVTRNGVLGKLFRLKIPLAGKSAEKRAPARKGRNGHIARKISTRFEDAATDPKGIELPPDSSVDAIPFMDARAGQCRYPLGDPSSHDFRFCGSAVFDGHSWCPRHCQIVYRPRKAHA